MRRIFSSRSDAIVTGAAGTQNLRMIHCKNRCECRVCVAVLANIGCLNVSEILACGIGAIMAANAVADDVHVTKIRGSKGNGRMTVITIVAGRNVSRMLAG